MADIDIPSLPLEEFEPVEYKDEAVQNTVNGACTYAFIGTGQAGCRIAKAFYDLGYKKAIVVNTAKQDLDPVEMPINQKYLMNIGQNGAGKDMQKGETAALKYQQEIFDMMKRIFGKCDHICLCVGAGGGTGAGSIFVLIEVAKKYMTHLGIEHPEKRVGVIAALPTDGELQSTQVKENAKKVMSELCRDAIVKRISPLLLCDNSKIEKMYRGLPPSQFWPTINGTIAGLFDIFNRLAIQDSDYTSFDSADYKPIMECHGCTIMGMTSIKEVKDETTISHALKANLEKTLLADGFDLSTATHAGVIVVGDQTVMNTAGMMDKFNYGFDVISNLVGKATVHRGIYQAAKPGLKVYTVIGGLDAPRKKLVELGASVKEIWPEEHK